MRKWQMPKQEWGWVLEGEESRRHGWVQLFQDKYPHAGGSEHYAAYLVNSAGFELELVATT